jgi:hypothetical protein
MAALIMPTELWLVVGQYLHPTDYQNLRMSSINILLPTRQRMLPLVYAKVTQNRRILVNFKENVEPFIELDLELIRQDIFDFLVWNHDFDQVLRVLKLKSPRIDPSSKGNKAIREASIRKRFDVVHELLSDKRVDPSAEYDIPLLMASRYRELDLLRKICSDDRVDPAMYDFVAFHEALTNDRFDSLEVLMQSVPRPVCQEFARMFDEPIVQELFSRIHG